MIFYLVSKFQKEIRKNELGKKKNLEPLQVQNLISQILEESNELLYGNISENYIAQVDALIDLIYFAAGGLYNLGLNSIEMEKCFIAVHKCNMEKKIGPKKRNGVVCKKDCIKPKGWNGPEEKMRRILNVR